MRLLSTTDLSFQEFYDSQNPKYAILSHRWIGDEVSFEDFYHVKAQDPYGERFAKIRNCCAYAEKNGFGWVWIDTCCIDKKSSAELTEAINSMFNWYRNAAICYVYLADVRWDVGDLARSRTNFRKSAWFERGWTLQELLAPARLYFFDCIWSSIGFIRKDSAHAPSLENTRLMEDICAATSISQFDLDCSAEYNFLASRVCVARKMSWLSSRKTSRVEDIAYCMLGLCGVNMPLLYGEREKAFERLQFEIIRTSDDESIFAWFSEQIDYPSSVLAESPKEFARSGNVVKHSSLYGKLPFAMTNKGLHYRIPRSRNGMLESEREYKYTLLLNCGLEDPSSTEKSSEAMLEGRCIAIELTYTGEQWFRYGHDQINLLDNAAWNDIVYKKHEYEDLYIHTW